MTSGLELERYKVLYKHWNSRENLEKIEYYEPDQDKEENKSDVLSSSKFLSWASKPGPQPKLASVGQLLLFYHGLDLVHDLNTQLGSLSSPNLLLPDTSLHGETANFIYFKVGCVPIWTTKDIVIEAMLERFEDTYPNARVIIDYTKLFRQNPSS